MYIAYTKSTVITFQQWSFWTCMNAVMHKYDITEGADMPGSENDHLAVQVAELRADVRHIQADVTDIKARFDKVDQRFNRVDEKFDRVDQRFESVKKEISEVKDSLASAKIWALGLYLALAGSLLYVLARGFKWF